jgi:hypothetical protein
MMKELAERGGRSSSMCADQLLGPAAGPPSSALRVGVTTAPGVSTVADGDDEAEDEEEVVEEEDEEGDEMSSVAEGVKAGVSDASSRSRTSWYDRSIQSSMEQKAS